MKKLLLCAAGASALMAGSANAATLLFTYTPADGVTRASSFQIDSNPTPTNSSAGKGFFQIANVPGSFQGGRTTATLNFFLTGGAAQNGGFEFDDINGGNSFLNVAGQQLFTGSITAPVFAVSTFELRGGTVRITQVGGAVPEPATWGLMVIGFGSLGLAMRRRQKVSVRYA